MKDGVCGVNLVCDVAVVGGGPAGLMAADALAAAGYGVHVFDRLPTVGRKFLLAGKGGLNLTHSEPFEIFVSRFRASSEVLAPVLAGFGACHVRDWAASLGVDTFVGTSGRVFPVDMKAAPLLRAWLRQLREPSEGHVPVEFHQRHRWVGWSDDGNLVFENESAGLFRVRSRATVLALGGASWPQLGSDGSWVPLLTQLGVQVSPLRSSNCGFDVAGGWSAYFADRHAGAPLKSVTLRVMGQAAMTGSARADAPVLFERKGECVITRTGIEGSVVYAASSFMREQIEASGHVTVCIDLLPDWSHERLTTELRKGRGSRSLSSHLKSRVGLCGVKAALLHECLGPEGMREADTLRASIKSLELVFHATRPVAEAISTAGGVSFAALASTGALSARPDVFCAGEMLDWEAPTGGYLLTACLATGRAAGRAAADYLAVTSAQDA